MTLFTLHDAASAPERSRPILEHSAGSLGFVPNLYGVLAGSPSLLKGYTTLSGIFESSALSATQRQVVLLTVSAENGCDYCVAAHSAIARAQKVAEETITAVRDGLPMPDEKLQSLREFTRQLVRQRGWVPERDVRAFLDSGFTTEEALDVILGIGLKTLSNYANHIASTPLDAAFSAHEWRLSRPPAGSHHAE
ncbi:MAG TPA: carboxymuconolactone decarboxylase family protein [Candidatus Polarisedimenticolia bacterium]|nr:carboxymuconolactone decarboxylase family protein [Candidatus Polarisedimenticolia bacterium]